MSQLVAILALGTAVSARLSFVLNNAITPALSAPATNPVDDMFSNIVNDMHFDISFDGAQPSYLDDDDYDYLDESPSSMFSFPPFPSFDSFWNSPMTPRSRLSPSKPMYLWVDSFSPSQTSSQSQSTPSVFVLEKTNKVNGNTYRYSVKSSGGNQRVITESWSSPKMYLCDSVSCGKDTGIEMTDIFNNFDEAFGQKYMHLVPSSTVEPLPLYEDDSFAGNEFDFEEEEPEEEPSMMGSMMHMMHGCHHHMRNWYYGYDVADPQYEEAGAGQEGQWLIVDDNEELMEEQQVQQASDNLILLGMSLIMVIISVCGMMYVAWRYLAECKQNVQSQVYVAMQETDQY